MRDRSSRKSGMVGEEVFFLEDPSTRGTGEKAFLLGLGDLLVLMVVITKGCQSTERLKEKGSSLRLIKATTTKVIELF
jgi:hypothetical protein